MKRIKINKIANEKTFEEGFDEFLFDCKSRNLRIDTLEHYEQGYKQLIKYLDEKTIINSINLKFYENFVVEVRKNKNINSQTIYTYARDLSTIIHFFQKKEYIPVFKIVLPKPDKKPVEVYSEEDIKKLLKKPNLKKCSWAYYRNYCIVSTFFGLGIRLSSLINIRIKDIDWDSETIKVMHTKNHKPLTLPIPNELLKILKEYLQHRQFKNLDDFLFCNIYGNQIKRNGITQAVRNYNKKCGVNKTSIHAMRHTFAKYWIMSGKSVATLQKALSHSSLQMTQNYINILTNDLKEDMQENNILSQFNNNRIKLR